MVLDRTVLAKTGAVALQRAGAGWERTDARPPGYQRPWARIRAPAVVPDASATRAKTPDATPKPEDLEPGD